QESFLELAARILPDFQESCYRLGQESGKNDVKIVD
ncbi:unnamed protein product, partial [Rotaria magnacalcarata]